MTRPLAYDFEYVGLDIITEREGTTLHRFDLYDFRQNPSGSFSIVVNDDGGSMSMDARIQQAHIELATVFKRWASKAEGLAMFYEPS